MGGSGTRRDPHLDNLWITTLHTGGFNTGRYF